MASIYESGAWTDFGSRTSQRIWDSHVKSAYLLASAAVSLFPKGKGRIVLFSDWVAASGRPRYKNFVHYYTAKYALIGLTQALALELAPRVLVSAIAPGPILPPKNLTNEETRHIEKVTPVGRWGGADEIAKAVLFLLDSNFVTGECIRVDGGRHLL
jgi:NAD(P)-dependent dehydrogenase (short-subunit alcohol dehydrogenase family)